MRAEPGSPIYRFHGLVLDPAGRSLSVADTGGVVSITPRAFDALVYLVEHRGTLVKKDALIAALWPNVVVDNNNLAQTISLLRRALGDTPQAPVCIATVAGRGYQFVADVEVLARRRRTALGEHVENEQRVATSVAVVPFVDLSDGAQHQYLAAGLSDELANALTRVRGVRVAAHPSSAGVEHRLEGSVRRVGDRVRVTARLTDCGSGYLVWSETYERRLADMFAIQDDIGRAVVAALQIALGVGELGRRPDMTRNVAAWDEYLLGIEHRRRARPEAVPAAIEHLERAVAIDPGFAAAWAALWTVCDRGAFMVPARATEWRRKGAEALEKARILAPDSPAVLLDTALELQERRRWLEAAAIHDRLSALPLPSDDDGQVWAARGRFLLCVGLVRDAVDVLERARGVRPLDSEVAVYLCDAYMSAGNVERSLAEVDRGLKLGNGFEALLRGLGLIAALGTRDRAVIEERIASLPSDDPSVAYNRELAGYLDAPQAAPAAIQRLAESAGTRRYVGFIPAIWAAYYEQPKLALVLARKINSSPLTLWRPLMREMRMQSAFKGYVRELGLVDYWRARAWADCVRPIGDADFEFS
jgi:DNA-binding winged helix-turn-helix (wHTH) protein